VDAERLLTLEQLAAVANISPHQLRHWVHRGLVSPYGEIKNGRPMRFAPGEARVVRLAAVLVNAGWDPIRCVPLARRHVETGRSTSEVEIPGVGVLHLDERWAS
jgi:hypothetical protein